MKEVLIEETLSNQVDLSDTTQVANIEEDSWDSIILPRAGWFTVNFKEIWQYRDLLKMFTVKDIVLVYKQTILGPIWFVAQPILTTLVFMLVFGRIAGLSTDGVPQILFYLSGVTLWNFFSDSFNNTSKTFKENEQIFGKVYFPRLIVPISKVVSGLIKFGIQFGLFVVVYIYFLLKGLSIQPTSTLILLPVMLILTAGMGLGAGIIFTSLTTKYRDLTFVIQFGVQLLMYGSAVIFPLSAIPEKYKMLILSNPITPVMEGFRYSLLGSGSISLGGIMYSCVFTILLLVFGVLIFNKTEKRFMDTV